MDIRTIQYGIAGCIVVLAAAIIYAIVRLYVLWHRVDLSILLVNIIDFGAMAAVLIYLTKISILKNKPCSGIKANLHWIHDFIISG